MWYRVFCRSDGTVQPGDIQTDLTAAGIHTSMHVVGDELGWTACTLRLPAGASLRLEHYETEADQLRDELNSWAAWLESQTQQPHHVALMQSVIETRHLYVMQAPGHENDSICHHVMAYIALHRDGVVQIDGQGFFAANGDWLLQES